MHEKEGMVETTTHDEVSRGKPLVSAIAFLLFGVAVVAGVGFTLHSVSKDSQKKSYASVNGTVTVDGKVLPHAFINQSVFPDDASARANHVNRTNTHPWPFYTESHLVLPAHSLVTMTLRGYEGGESLNHNYFAKVVGTVDGTMMVDGQQVTSLKPTEVQHTFTLHGLPTSTQEPLFVNVPLPKVEDADMEKNGSHLVVFSFVTGGAGEYVWNCEYPCGDGTYAKFGAVMGQNGYMSGKVSVVNG
jgi:hypothetical protein